MHTKFHLKRVQKCFFQFTPIKILEPTWIASLPRKAYDCAIGFCEARADTEAFALFEHATILMCNGAWVRVEHSEIAEIRGAPGAGGLDTSITLESDTGRAYTYRGVEAYGLWSCIKYLQSELKRCVEFKLPDEVSQALLQAASAKNMDKDELVKSWVIEWFQQRGVTGVGDVDPP